MFLLFDTRETVGPKEINVFSTNENVGMTERVAEAESNCNPKGCIIQYETK
jgi:hypothetical protein